MPTRLLVAMLALVTASAHAAPDSAQVPDGIFYGVRMIPDLGDWGTANQLIRIDPAGTVQAIAPLWGRDGRVILSAAGDGPVWHPFYKRLFALAYGPSESTNWVSIDPANGHVEPVIRTYDFNRFADFAVVPDDPHLYALWATGDILIVDPRVNDPPVAIFEEPGCRAANRESRAGGLAYIPKGELLEPGFYVAYSDCPLGAFQVFTAPDGPRRWVGASMPAIQGLFWDRGTQRLYGWNRVAWDPTDAFNRVQFWIIDPQTGRRHLAFEWALERTGTEGGETYGWDLDLDFVPSSEAESIACLVADLNGDNAVDLRDFQLLQNCMTGPVATPPFNP